MTSFIDLVRLSLTRPAEAARIVLAFSPSGSVIAQGALLLAIVSVLLRDALAYYVAALSPDPMSVVFPPVLIDLGEQFAGVYLVSYLTVFMARIFGAQVAFPQAVTVYIWYNLVLSAISFVMLGGFFVLGGLALVLSLAVGGWAIWAAAHFWAALLGGDNLVAGFFLALGPVILGSIITIMVASILDLPMLEFTSNV